MARKKISNKPRRTILIVTATEAEALYFSQMRKDCRYSNLTVLWEEEFKDLEHLITLASRYRNTGNYSVVWVLFGLADLDVAPSEVKKLLPYAKKEKSELGLDQSSHAPLVSAAPADPQGICRGDAPNRKCFGKVLAGLLLRCFLSVDRRHVSASEALSCQGKGFSQC